MTIEEFRERLRRDRERLMRTVQQTDEELATLEPHQPGAPAEDAQMDAAADVLARVEGRERYELDEIDAAQARLEAGTYGTCEACNSPIPITRLRALPTARYCVACQARRER